MLKSLFDDVLKKLPNSKVEDYDLDLDYPHDEIIEIDPEIFESTELVPMPEDQDYDPEFSDVDEKEIGIVEGGVRAGGIEILAFYKSYRHVNEPPFRGEWGIFYINRGVQYIDQMLSLAFPGVENCRKIALDFLWSHEIFHAKFDLGILGFEAFSRRHLYLPQKLAFRRAKAQQPEEALANESAWRYAKSVDPDSSFSKQARTIGIQGISDFFYHFMKNQPGAYARFDENQFDLKSETAAGVFSNQRYRSARLDDLAHWVGLHPKGLCGRSDVPTHLILRFQYSKLISPARWIPPVKEIKESKKFLDEIQPSQKSFWEKTKSKLLKSSCRPGLDFKYFQPPNIWSARVNDNFRVHFLPVSLDRGVWEAVSFGSHKDMGHG